MRFLCSGIPLGLCVAMLGACSGDTRGRSARDLQMSTTGPSGSEGMAAPVAPSRYPYGLFLGSSFYRVEQEPERGRLIVELAKWSDTPDGGKDAVFRVTNTGDRAVLVWNVRQQVCVSGSDGVARVWETRHNGFPGRGWENAMLMPGESEEFPIPSDPEGEWRVCLLYSREIPRSQASHRQFDGTFESISPNVREAD